ncbi:MAG TPA: hypothetical protein VI259_10925 [Gemmatimonadaceae bacterium]
MQKPVYACFHGRPAHPAFFIRCDDCLARPTEPCLSTVHMIGTGVSDDMPITGMHAARVHRALELDADGHLARPDTAA